MQKGEKITFLNNLLLRVNVWEGGNGMLVEVVRMHTGKEVKTMGKSWAEFVKEWNAISLEMDQAANGFQWRRGDLLAELAETFDRKTLDRFADHMGQSKSQLYALRQVSVAFPASSGSRRLDLPWSVYRAFATQDDRFKLVKTWDQPVSKAEELASDRRTEATRKKWLDKVPALAPKVTAALEASPGLTEWDLFSGNGLEKVPAAVHSPVLKALVDNGTVQQRGVRCYTPGQVEEIERQSAEELEGQPERKAIEGPPKAEPGRQETAEPERDEHEHEWRIFMQHECECGAYREIPGSEIARLTVDHFGTDGARKLAHEILKIAGDDRPAFDKEIFKKEMEEWQEKVSQARM